MNLYVTTPPHPIPARHISKLALILVFMILILHHVKSHSYVFISRSEKKMTGGQRAGCVCEGNILTSGLVCLGEFACFLRFFGGVILGRKYIPKVRNWFLLSPPSREIPVTQE